MSSTDRAPHTHTHSACPHEHAVRKHQATRYRAESALGASVCGEMVAEQVSSDRARVVHVVVAASVELMRRRGRVGVAAISVMQRKYRRRRRQLRCAHQMRLAEAACNCDDGAAYTSAQVVC